MLDFLRFLEFIYVCAEKTNALVHLHLQKLDDDLTQCI